MAEQKNKKGKIKQTFVSTYVFFVLLGRFWIIVFTSMVLF